LGDVIEGIATDNGFAEGEPTTLDGNVAELNAVRSSRPLRPHSSSSSVVIKKPERTKKRSTPRNPPGSQDTPP
jgi:hypothetical protein